MLVVTTFLANFLSLLCHVSLSIAQLQHISTTNNIFPEIEKAARVIPIFVEGNESE